MCDVSGCSSEVGSGSDDGRDAMQEILDEFQRLYQGRMARLERDPAAPNYGKDKMHLLEDWIGDLNQQNRTLVETVKELETEASQRCEMLESRLVTTTSSTKQYMLQLHQLQRQVQQLMAGRLQAESRAGEMTSLVDQLTTENEQLRGRLQLPSDGPLQLPSDGPLPADTDDRWQHWAGRLTPAAGDSDGDDRSHIDQTDGGDVTNHVQRLKADLRTALRDKDDLQEILDIRKCELEESQSEVAGLRSELDRLKSTLGTGTAAGTGAGTARRQLEPPAEVHRLQKHCRDLVDQRNEALAELAKVKVTLMEVMEQQVEEREETAPTPDDSSVSESDVTSEEQDVTKPAPLANGRLVRQVVRRQPSNQSKAQRLENQVEERDQLVAALQGHLGSARNEVALKDETLARLETKLDATRQELGATIERLAGADGERAALKQQNQILTGQVSELQQRADEAASVSRRLESEADQQMAQITDLQERLLAAETNNKELTVKCVQKDVEIGRQWTTISSLQEALLLSKQEVESLQPAPSFLGSLLGGGVRRDVRDV